MKCTRCEGLMLEDDCLDMGALLEPMWSRAWRCLNCGHATDSVMEANRQRQAVLISAHGAPEEIVFETHEDVFTTAAA